MSTPCEIRTTPQRIINLERNAGKEYIAPPRFWFKWKTLSAERKAHSVAIGYS